MFTGFLAQVHYLETIKACIERIAGVEDLRTNEEKQQQEEEAEE
jgi:hypothetical protein